MKAMTSKTVYGSNSVIRLDAIPMSDYERWRAHDSLRQGELFSEFVMRAVADIRAVVHGIEHAAAGVVSGIRAMLAKPVKH